MGRKVKPKTRKDCLICGDEASGINFNALTCMSCKAFFRRNALRSKEFKCPFANQCKVDMITRKFCTKCRLRKCFSVGMKKEWILTDEEKQHYKNKVVLNRIRREREVHDELHDDDEDEGDNQESDDSNSQQDFSEPFFSNSSTTTLNSNFETLNSSHFESQNLDLESYSNSLSNRNYSFSSTGSSDHSLDLMNLDFNSSFNFEPQPDRNQTPDILYQSMLLSQIDPTQEISSSSSSISSLSTSSDSALDDLCNQLFQDSNLLDLSSLDMDDDEMISDFMSFSDSFVESCKSTNLLSIDDHTYSSAQPVEVPHEILSTDSLLPIYPEISFPSRELMDPEKFVIQELVNACSVLHNPYKAIRDYSLYHPICSNKISQYYFYRMIRMCKRLQAFGGLLLEDQALMLKGSLMELLAIRSILLFHPDRDAWCFVDDKNQVSVMVKMELLKPFAVCDFKRHEALPRRFRDEWKRDSIIFDLLTAIVLFTPRFGYQQSDRIDQEHQRYSRLLIRYLEMKYATKAEAQSCFSQLMVNLDEMRALNVDVWNFFIGYSDMFMSSPLFAELLNGVIDKPKAILPHCSSNSTTISLTNQNKSCEILSI